VNLTDDLAQFVDQQVESGRHQDAGDVMREALRRYSTDIALETERIGAIREVIREGREAIASGAFHLVDGPDDETALFAKWTRRDNGPVAGGE